ncbi:uncharacterized protein LOC127001346 isoform X4 [Eriocheir sinensis]|uniref:uncharacterized protein LOC127001346 isoform X4 n=1 Tax=Eriocheir sinensis TaxID=95602 RepID=UPI0021C67F5F|nr:uncharacterized protein LOC127001346 isoform X4 [Eriocheir sinensis]
MCTSQNQNTTLYQPRTRTALVWACVWVWASVIMGVWGGCPKVCECFWRDALQTVACRGADFIDIPRGIEPSTQVLDLSHNNLKILPRDAFAYTGLVNLQKVMLNHCNLIFLEKGSFNSVENVKELDLSNNHLRAIPSAALMNMLMLRELRLAHNNLTTIPAAAFHNTPHIVQLDLSHNKIQTVEVGALKNLSELEILNLAENKLTVLSSSELVSLVLLRVIRVDGNPWRCTCHLRPLRQWFHDRNLAASVPPSCSYPKWLLRRDWQLLEKEELLCAPQVSAVAPRVLAAHGENVSLLCRVETEVETTVTWYMGDVPLVNDSDLQRDIVVDLITSNNTSYVSNLTITDVASEDQGTYRCVAENRAGVREVNFTLQVSHEVAEVRVANMDVSYMKEGLLGGVSVLLVVMVLVCSVLYCKVRGSRETRRDEDSVETAQSSRSSECDPQHKLAGYHVIPTNDMEESSPKRHEQPDPSWSIRHRGPGDFPLGNGGEMGGEERSELPEGAAAQPTASGNLPYVDPSGKDEVMGTRLAALEAGHWKEMMCPKDMFPHRVCSRSVSQVSLSGGRQYPDLLDLPHPQLGLQLQQHLPLQEVGQELQGLAAAASCSRPRTYSDASGLGGSGGAGAAQDGQTTLETPLSQVYTPQDHSDSRTEGAGADGGACSHLHTADPCHFEYHAAQLEKFLTEYRCLQEQLIHMKQSYEAHKRAGSIPSLDCCPASAGGQRSDYPKGVTCCSCGHKGAYMQTAGVPPLPTEFAQTSLSDTTVTMPQTSAAATGFSDTPQPNEPSLDNNSTQATAGYAESFMPSRQYLDDGLAQQQGAGYVAMGETSVASPGTQSPARGSPKTNTLTKASKEPLKSILKKNTEGGGGRRRGDQWTRSASCCERRTGPAPLGDPAYAVAPDSRSKTTENLQPADLPRPAPGHGHYEP